VQQPNPDPSSRTESSLRNSPGSSVTTSAAKIEVRYKVEFRAAAARAVPRHFKPAYCLRPKVAYCEHGGLASEVASDVVADFLDKAFVSSKEPDSFVPLPDKGRVKPLLDGNEIILLVEQADRLGILAPGPDGPSEKVMDPVPFV